MEKFILQSDLDVKKWLESESRRHDLCGTYDYCTYCEMKNQYPCASAFIALEASKTTAVKLKKPSLSFAEKLLVASDVVKEIYTAVSNILDNTSLVNRLTKSSDNYRFKRTTMVKIRLISKGLGLFLALDPANPEFLKIPHANVSATHALVATPFKFRVTSPLALRRVEILVDALTKDLVK